MSLNLTRDELQDLINRRFGNPHPVPWDEVDEARDCPRDNRTPPDIMIAREVAKMHIAERVAEYMAAHYRELRPTLRRVGPDGVRDLVFKILSALPTDDYDASKTAHALNLDPATYNRIAGKTGFSDIARFTARLCLQDEQVMEFACECGMWVYICRFLDDEEER